jgi:hypothetical protein
MWLAPRLRRFEAVFHQGGPLQSRVCIAKNWQGCAEQVKHLAQAERRSRKGPFSQPHLLSQDLKDRRPTNGWCRSPPEVSQLVVVARNKACQWPAGTAPKRVEREDEEGEATKPRAVAWLTVRYSFCAGAAFCGGDFPSLYRNKDPACARPYYAPAAHNADTL